MFNSLSGIYPNIRIQQAVKQANVGKVNQLICDTVSFKGAQPRDYKCTFDYMISQSDIFAVEPYSSQKSPTKIKNAIVNYLDSTNDYKIPVEAEKENNSFCKTYNDELKNDIITSVNNTRKEAFAEWNELIENGDVENKKEGSFAKELSQKINANPALKLVIWQALSSDISSNNRHIPLPLNLKTLSDTIEHFESLDKTLGPKELNQFRSHKAKNAKSFNDVYTSKLIENTLISLVTDRKNSGVQFLDETGMLIQNPNINTFKNVDKGIWVCIPSSKTNLLQDNVPVVENLSHKNWCTRSKVDKAAAALQDGTFYIFLEKEDDKFVPQLGVTSANGKLAKIQGESNNNFINTKYLDIIENFLLKNGAISENGGHLVCNSSRDDEGPDIYNTYLILKELSNNPEFSAAIKEKDYFAFLNHLKPGNATYDKNGNIVVKKYNSIFCFKNKFPVALSDFGIDEVEMLKSIKSATGKVITQNSPNEEIKKYSGLINNIGNNLFESINLQAK